MNGDQQQHITHYHIFGAHSWMNGKKAFTPTKAFALFISKSTSCHKQAEVIYMDCKADVPICHLNSYNWTPKALQ